MTAHPSATIFLPMKKTAFIFFQLCVPLLAAQITFFPFKESFDNIVIPALPPGWTTSSNKNINGDFTTSITSVRTPPNAASSTDATKSQSLVSPLFDFSGRSVDSLEFYERRTSTHLARVLVEASIGADTAFGIRISRDSLRLVSNSAYIRRAFMLPDTLSGKMNVRFRIRIIADTNGSSGIYRIDDVRLTVKKTKDLAVTSCTASPVPLTNGDHLTVTVGITNRAMAANYSATVRLFDSLTFIASQNISHQFSANDSLTIALHYPNIKPGRHPLTAVLIADGDEDTTNNYVSTVINAGYRRRNMLINEIMYAPSPGMPEWMEIVHNCDDTIPITGWKVSDAGTVRSAITPLNRSILPHSYFIITTDTNAFKNIYTVSVPIMQSSFSSLNNSGDAVVLYDHNNNMIDSVTFISSWGGGTGKSLERIDTASSSYDQSNWSSSKHTNGATPGVINSVTKKSFDASVVRMSASPQYPVAGNGFSVSSIIKNVGRQILTSVQVQIYIDINKDSLLTANELQYQQEIPVINPSDSETVQLEFHSLPQGIHWFGTKISAAIDDDTSNNILFYSQSVGIQSHSIVVTEFMYAPPGDMPEWIEGYNTTSSTVSIGGWKISDNGTTKVSIQDGQQTIAPNSYFVVTTDTVQFKSYFPFVSQLFQVSFPALNNSSPDAIVLTDERGAVMESVYYRQQWGGTNGNSLQRFDTYALLNDSANWVSGIPSPGRENSAARKDFDVAVQSISSTNYSNYTDVTAVIVNKGRDYARGLTVSFFHDINQDGTTHSSGRLSSSAVTEIAPMESASVTYCWNTSLRGKQHVIVTVDYPPDERIQNNTALGTITKKFPPQTMVLNEIMYEPRPGNAEFTEILNRSSDSIDIADWKLMDQPNSSGYRTVISLSDSSRILPPGGFVLIASDSSILTQFSSPANENIIIRPSLSVSNSGEDLILADLTGAQIDSVHFFPSWHLKNLPTTGRSLERINPNAQTNDSRNWSSSVAARGSTPARCNSIYFVSSAAPTSLLLSPNPFSPDRDGFEDFLSINYTLPSNSTVIRIRIFDVNGRLVRRLAQSELSPSAGSITWNGLDDDGNLVRIGMYIVLFEALDNFGGVARTMKDVAVVGRKL